MSNVELNADDDDDDDDVVAPLVHAHGPANNHPLPSAARRRPASFRTPTGRPLDTPWKQFGGEAGRRGKRKNKIREKKTSRARTHSALFFSTPPTGISSYTHTRARSLYSLGNHLLAVVVELVGWRVIYSARFMVLGQRNNEKLKKKTVFRRGRNSFRVRKTDCAIETKISERRRTRTATNASQPASRARETL